MAEEKRVFTFESGRGFTQVDETPIVSKESNTQTSIEIESPKVSNEMDSRPSAVSENSVIGETENIKTPNTEQSVPQIKNNSENPDLDANAELESTEESQTEVKPQSTTENTDVDLETEPNQNTDVTTHNVDVDEIYKAYPTRCNKSNRSTSKSNKDKDKIKKLLKIHDKNHILKVIALYVEDSKDSYIKNFATFLNNFPDLESFESKKYKYNDEDYKVVLWQKKTD